MSIARRPKRNKTIAFLILMVGILVSLEIYFEWIPPLSNLSPDTWVAIGTFLVVLTALFGEWFKSLIFRAKLSCKSTDRIPQTRFERPDGVGLSTKKYYTMYRIVVTNIGFSSARDVRASITDVPLPVPLNWTHIDSETRDISKGEPAYLDIFIESHDVFRREKISFAMYGFRDKVINLPQYRISAEKPTHVTVSFYERDRTLGSVHIKLDPVERRLEVV